jgi:putative flippase GtrA
LSQRSWSLARLSQHSAVRFLMVGGLTFTVDEAALYVFHGVARVWLPLATVLAFAIAFGVNFGLNRFWVFSGTAVGRAAGNGAAEGAVGRQVGRYVVLVIFNLVVTFVCVPALTALGVFYLISKAVVAGVLAIINYVVSRTWIFL